MREVALTGGIATGKSTVAAAAADAGVPVVDADALARKAVAPGSAGLREVVARFGSGVLAADGALDRAALGRDRLRRPRRPPRSRTHRPPAGPGRGRRVLRRPAGDLPAAIAEIPLAFETGLVPELRRGRGGGLPAGGCRWSGCGPATA